MTIAIKDKPVAGLHESMNTVDNVVQFVVPQGGRLELYERIDGAYVKIAEYGGSDELDG